MNNKASTSCLEHFSEKGNEWADLYKRATFADRLKLFLDLPSSKLHPSARILDFGCGSGVISFSLAKQGFEVTGVDGASGMIEAANRQKINSGLTNVTFTAIDPGQPCLETKAFDAIVCSSVLEYLPDDQQTLHLFHNALKPGGWIFISIPNKFSLIGKLEDKLKAMRAKPDALDIHFCQRRYDPTSFVRSLADLGFSSFDIRYFELPKLGKIGVPLSRFKYFGVMLLIAAQKSY